MLEGLTVENLSEKIISLFLKISRNVKKNMVIECKNGSRINPLQMHALLLIDQKEEITMKELAQNLDISSPSATAFADRLVKNNWAKRYNDPKNRRSVKLCLTDFGKNILEKKREERKKLTKKLIESIPVKDRKDLLRILEEILSNLEN